MNLPNKLSVFRILLVPVIAFLYLFFDAGSWVFEANHIHVSWRICNFIVLILFGVASFTDFLDGNIARKRNLITSFGKFIDPIADKLLVNTMFILFAVSGVISVIPVILMIWRDTIVDGLRMHAGAKGKVVAAGKLGKLKTVLQMFAIVLLLLQNMPFVFFGFPLAEILLWSATIVSVVSGVDYFLKMKDIVMESI